MVFSEEIHKDKNKKHIAMNFFKVLMGSREAKKNMKSIAWHFSIDYTIFAKVNLSNLTFFNRGLYLSNWYEICTVDFWGHMYATVIFSKFMEH